MKAEELTRHIFMQIKKMNDQSGFTLIEIVLAVLIFGIVTTTLFFSYNSLFQAREAIDKKTKMITQAETALLRIVEDLENFYCEKRPLYKESEEIDFESKYFFYAENVFSNNTTSSKISFTSYAHLGFGGDISKSPSQIFYFLKGNILYRGDFIYPYPETEDEKEKKCYQLCKNVKKFKLIFFDEEKNEYENWNSDEAEYKYATPKRAKLEFEIALDGEVKKFETEILFPVFRKPKEE